MNNSYSILFRHDRETGVCSLIFEGFGSIDRFCGAYHDECGRLIKTTDYKNHVCHEEIIEDELGSGKQFTLRHFTYDTESLTQYFTVYEEGFASLSLSVEREGGVSTNYLAPLYCRDQADPVNLPGEVRFLAAPFDNDKWAKFVDYPAKHAAMGYEFTVLHPGTEGGGNAWEDGRGMVAGSVDHDTWKTGLGIGEDFFEIFCGAATEDTRDMDGIAHGSVSGGKVDSARIFIGGYRDYREGLKAFGRCNARIRPALPWDGPVIFGWNSWAALMGQVELDSYKEASDFMKTIQDSYCGTDGRQYINFDACWNRFSNKMPEAVEHVRRNGQVPGTYFCPFITGSNFRQEVSGTDGNYFYEDLLLKDHEGKVLFPVDGLYSLDPTHPGTLQHMEYELNKIIKWGFGSIKTDFVGHGCREGAFYNKEITTGVQAYHYGMQHFVDCLKAAPEPVFISLSIAPIFPSGYGHARRISCDAFGSLDQSAYLNNCITYLWWMNDCLYRFNDPDHIVVYRTYDKHSTTLEEGRTRYHSGVICGSLMITSDDYRIPAARERAQAVLCNKEVNRIAGKGQSFYPLSGNFGEAAADVFVREDEESIVAAVFNYSISDEKVAEIDLKKLGWKQGESWEYEDLWYIEEGTSKGVSIDGLVRVILKPAESKILRFKR